MKPAVCLKGFSGMSFAVAAVMLLVELTACGSDSGSRPDGAIGAETGALVDAPVAVESGRWPAEITVSTCQERANVPVGSYLVQTDYWNKEGCPGTQCIDVNKATGAFKVTQGPEPCGDNVASYPNVLYGCSFGDCSPATMLPMQVSALSTVTSSWDFSVEGSASDRYNVAYDIWFCPEKYCGSSGFAGGVELMIWLDYKNVRGWQNDLGPVTLAGHSWDRWQATFGSAMNSWTYLAYMIQAPMVTSVADLDLNAFVRDAVAKGIVQDSWYLYAIHAGTELRTGGVPYQSNSFSVSINGVTPAANPDGGVAPGETGSGSCDGGVPTATGGLVVSDTYVTAGSLHGYAEAWTWVGETSHATACASPACSAPNSLQLVPIVGQGVAPLTSEVVSCAPAFSPTALCTAGMVTADPTNLSVAGLGFNLSQETGGDGGANASSVGTIAINKSITLTVDKVGSASGNSALLVQLTDSNNNFYCVYDGRWTSGVPIPITQFSRCWDNAGVFATSKSLFKRVDILLPSSASKDRSFAFCLTNVAVE
jgi:hypothetical protein